MKSCQLALTAVGTILIASSSLADAPYHVRFVANQTEQAQAASLEVQQTPEMWLYEKERERYEDPRAAVRRKAEFRAQQRQQRIAFMKAFGLSKQRPLCTDTPFYTYYSTYIPNGWLKIRNVAATQIQAADFDPR